MNKIAAGEVIERPFSVVKELVENALDAGATRIDLAVEDGGKKLIAVTDNGGGMTQADLALAFAPHATSKLTGEDDLYHICTMGFRGEALASIASISHAHIRTCKNPQVTGQAGDAPPTSADISGYEVDASGETIGQPRPCPAAPGTTITIRDLFFNTPARRKFLRTAATELGHITEQIARLALPHPQVAFSVTHNGKKALTLPATASTLQRATDLFGQDLAAGLLTVRPRSGPIRVNGLISSPAGARASGKWQYIFLNGRYIRDRLLSHALRDAYRGLMDPSRWPVALLFLEMDPQEVDVNVHPTKIEVRFRDGQAVHAELLAALRDTLNHANLTPDASLASSHIGGPANAGEPIEEAPATTDVAANPQAEQRNQSLRQALADFFKSTPPQQPRLSFPPEDRSSRPTFSPPPVSSYSPAREVQDIGGSLGSIHQDTDSVFRVPQEGNYPPSSLPASINDAPAEPPLAGTVLQIHDSYIVTACPDGLLIVDQHALHERVLYNDFKRRLADGTLTGQRLLIPEPMTVTPTEADAVHRHADLLGRLGIEVAPFGPTTIALQQFPTLLAERGVQSREFLRELLDRLTEDDHLDPEQLLESILETLACKAAVKAGDPLTPTEIHALLARRDEADKGSACPHGRPTTLKLTLKDLEKQFKR